MPLFLSSDTPDIINHATWNAFVASHPRGHLLQTWEWGELKASFDWRAIRLGLVEDGRILAGTQVLFKRVPPLFSIAYVPKGPLVDWSNRLQVKTLCEGLHQLCQSRRSVFLKLEPHLPHNDTAGQVIMQQGFVASQHTIQPPRTILVDLTPGEESILAAMKQKTRYNIRLARRKGVTVRRGSIDDVPTFHRLMQVTGERDQFGVHNLDYFRTAFELFSPDRVALLLAEIEDEPVAGLMAFAQPPTAYYLFGASSNAHRKKMPTYRLQWEAMRWAKSKGCSSYDLWGIPDADEETLEAQFTARSRASSGLWGVYRFKRGFGGQVMRSIGAFDYVYHRPLYWLYSWWMARRQGGMA